MFPARPLFLLALLFALALGLDFEEPTDCYFATGTPSKLTTPCRDASFGPTGCCIPGDMCLNNTLCATKLDNGDIKHYRGTCTDSTWSSPSCPRFCVDEENVSLFATVHPCGDSKTPTKWYCEGKSQGNAACKLPNDTFSLSGNLTTYAIAPFPAGVSPKPKPTPPNPSTNQATPSVALQLGNVQPAAPTPAAPGQDTADLGPPAVPFAPSAPEESGNAGVGVPIGVGVTVGVCIIVAASVMGFFYVRKRRREAPVRAETPPPYEFAVMGPQTQGPLGTFHRAKLA